LFKDFFVQKSVMLEHGKEKMEENVDSEGRISAKSSNTTGENSMEVHLMWLSQLEKRRQCCAREIFFVYVSLRI